MPTEPIRVHALAKELGIKSREILDAVAERLEDLELKGHQSWLGQADSSSPSWQPMTPATGPQ